MLIHTQKKLPGIFIWVEDAPQWPQQMEKSVLDADSLTLIVCGDIQWEPSFKWKICERDAVEIWHTALKI